MTTIAKPGKARLPWAGRFAAIFAVLIVAVAGAASPAVAQSETLVYSFAGGTSDGANPYAALVFNSTDTILYGTTLNGGASGDGVIFAVTLAAAQTRKH